MYTIWWKRQDEWRRVERPPDYAGEGQPYPLRPKQAGPKPYLWYQFHEAVNYANRTISKGHITQRIEVVAGHHRATGWVLFSEDWCNGEEVEMNI